MPNPSKSHLSIDEPNKIMSTQKPNKVKSVSGPKRLKPALNIIEKEKALKGYAISYEVEIADRSSVIYQLTASRLTLGNLIKLKLSEIKGMKLMETLKVTFEKNMGTDKTIHKTAFFNSRTKTVTNHKDVFGVLRASMSEMAQRIGVWISEGSGWTIDSINNHYANVNTYKPLRGSSYMELPVELRNSKKGLINIKKL